MIAGGRDGRRLRLGLDGLAFALATVCLLALGAVAVAVAAIALTAWALTRGRADAARLGDLAGLLPMLPALGLLGVLLVRHAAGELDGDRAVLWLVYPTLATILLRQVIALEELRRRSASLEAEVAERSAALAEVQDHLERRQQLESLGRLAGGVAHDFNNLLTAISGYAHLVARRLPPDDPARAHVVELRLAVERGAGLTRQILTFARSQPGAARLVAPAQVVGELASLLGRVAGDVDVEIQPEAATPCVRIDPAQLEQLVMALATNAREAMPAGGRVRLGVGVRRLAAGEVAAGDAGPGPYVTIAVADDGAGIPPASMPHLFAPFYSTKPRGAGAGLGLASSYGIVRRAGGFFTVASTPGRGARFVAHLPVATDGAGPGADAPAVASDAPAQRWVLLVDDSPALRATLTEALRAQAYGVLVADSGDQAVALAERHVGAIDVLVTDLVMPGRDGVAAATAIRARRPQLPVILISGFGQTDVDRLPHGFELLAKPFAPPELVARIQHALGQDLA